jgi:protein O-GlcNAc transferase
VNTSKNTQESARLQAALSNADWPLLYRLCRQALRKNRRNLTAHRLLGYALTQQRKPDKAIEVFSAARAQWPDDAELLINFGNLYLEQGFLSEALPLLTKVCELRPGQAVCWVKLSECCYYLNQHDEGFSASQKALELAQNNAEQVAALMQRAIHRRELGQVREAVQDCDTAIALQPYDAGNYTNKLLFMLADPQRSAVDFRQVAHQFSEVFEAPQREHWPTFAERNRAPWRRLKIGFVSPDLRDHAVMYFVEGLLAQLDRRQFEVFAFFLYSRGDGVTARVKCHADHFIHLAQRTPAQQAAAIREQGIDIVIDLAGHTGHNALLALASKPAPIQVSWLGYPATTGLTAMDYRFTDEVTDPADAQDQYAEQLYRLPTFFCCYRPQLRNPLWRYQPAYAVRPTPALANGYITFGSCNNLGKLTDEVLTLWGQVLRAVAGSHLLVEGKNLGNPVFSESYRARCQSLGIDVTRLTLIGQDRANQYLTYHRIDIALDPFPLTGGTTTFDVLWMGVPIVSMVGDSFRSRMGTGILSYLDRTDWLAQTPNDYVRIATELSADVQALNTLRLGLRVEVETSSLMREDIFIHHFGEGLRTLWLQWCACRDHPDTPDAQAQALQNWIFQFPPEWEGSPEIGVGLASGHRITLAQAHDRMQVLLGEAKSCPPNSGGAIQTPLWVEITELAESVLCATPNDPVALACLAEVEHAHGHTEFAVTYLRYAAAALR